MLVRCIKRNEQSSQQGIALVSVLLCVMLVMILASTILRMSYLAYDRIMTEKKSDNNFYDAEAVVDDVQMALQSSVSMVLSSVSDKDASSFIVAAYNYITSNDNLDSDDLTEQFFLKLDDDTTDSAPSEKQLAVGTQELLDAYYPGYETRGGDFKITYINKPSSGDSSFEVGLHVKYINETGYVSEITTDIVIKSPTYASSVDNALGTYSMFCGSGADVQSLNGSSQKSNGHPEYFIQEGNVYIGAQTSPATGYDNAALIIYHDVTFDLPGDNIVINGDIYVTGSSVLRLTGALVEVRGTIHLDENAYLVVGSDTELVCQDIEVGGKSVKNGEYSCSSSGTEYGEYFPYAYVTADSSYYDGERLGALESDYQNDNMSGNILYLDSSSEKTYLLTLDYPDTIPAEGSSIIWRDKDNNQFSGTIYFDSTLTQNPKVTTYVYYELTGETIQTTVDDKFAEFINMDGLVRLQRVQGTSSGSKLGGINDDGTCDYLYQLRDITLSDDADLGQYVVNSTSLTLANNYAEYKHAYDTDSGVVTKTYYASKTRQSISIGNVTNNVANPTNYFEIWIMADPFEAQINDSSYLGIYMSADKVTFKVNGKATGYSILDMGSSAECQELNYKYLKEYMDEFGYYLLINTALADSWYTDTNPYYGYAKSQEYYYSAVLMNNVFNGGTSVFYSAYDDDDGSSSKTNNEGLDFISPDEWEITED